MREQKIVAAATAVANLLISHSANGANRGFARCDLTAATWPGKPPISVLL
jgi:hypothetical protein